MMSNPNTINYSNLNKALQPKRGLTKITAEVSKRIGDVFLENNTKVRSESGKTNRLNGLADAVENSSESVKTRFVITVNSLMEMGLLRTDQIKRFDLSGADGNKIFELSWMNYFHI